MCTHLIDLEVSGTNLALLLGCGILVHCSILFGNLLVVFVLQYDVVSTDKIDDEAEERHRRCSKRKGEVRRGGMGA